MAVVPGNAKARVTLAAIRLDAGDLVGASEQAEQALAVLEPLADERNTAASFALAGRVFRARGEAAREEPERTRWFERARRALDRGERVDIAAARVYAQLGTADVYQEMGLLYTDLRDPQKAALAFERARRTRAGTPDPADTAGLVSAYYGQGAWRRAAVTLNEGHLLHPNVPRFLAMLPGLYREQAPGSCAVDGAGRLQTSCAMVHADRCAALFNVAQLYRERGVPAAAVSLEQTAKSESCAH